MEIPYRYLVILSLLMNPSVVRCFSNFLCARRVGLVALRRVQFPARDRRGAVRTVEVMTSQGHDFLHSPDASAHNLLSGGDDLAELQSFSRHLLAKLDESRSIGQFGQAEIELLRKKLSVVVSAFSAERQKIENELNAVRLRCRRVCPSSSYPTPLSSFTI